MSARSSFRSTLFLGAVLALSACSSGAISDGGDVGDADPGTVDGKQVIDTARGPAIANELVLRLAIGDTATAEELVAQSGGTVVWRGPSTGAYLVRFHDGAEATRALAELAARSEVLDVNRSLIVDGTGFGTSPGTRLQWNLPAMSLHPASGWSTAAGVRVAVLDTGVAYEDFADAQNVYALAPDLAGVAFAAGYDFVHDDTHPNDDHGHGTHVTGVIASSGALAAVASGAEILPVKVLDRRNRGTELGLAEGLMFAADHGADVINLSLSFAPAYFPSRFMQEAVDHVSASGAVMVAAAGNQARDVVTYPAAFRDVIAVGASQLSADVRISGGKWPWKHAASSLERASYSNRGYLLDVSAPGGSITGDLDGDGNPEAILAQSFLGADPTDFQYVNYAGTSQAAAHVSGIAAVMLAENPDLEPEQVRATLGEVARRSEDGPLSATIGRGFVNAALPMKLADSWIATRARPHHSAGVRLVLLRSGANRVARATVEVLEPDGHPAGGVEVFGSFSGGAFESHHGTTDAEGHVEFTSGTLSDPRLVAFQVEAVVSRQKVHRHDHDGDDDEEDDDHDHDRSSGHWHEQGQHGDHGWGTWQLFVDRPGGFVRMDSCSLDLLSRFAEVAGSGFGTSPGTGPISLQLPAGGADEVDSVALLNFSWAVATPAMAVVADADWYSQTYPDAASARVTSSGLGALGDPLRFTPASFPLALDDVDTDECVDLVVRTFGSGFGTSPGSAQLPIVPDPDGSCSQDSTCPTYRVLLETLWHEAIIPGDPNSSYDSSSGVSEATWNHLMGMMEGYSVFGAEPLSSPVADYDDALDAAGIGAAPYGPGISGGVGAASWDPP